MRDEDLRAWTAADAPPGFADRVMVARRAQLEPPRWKMRLGLAIGLGAAALAAAAALGVGRLPPPRSGKLVAADRETLRIGDRALAVAEPGSDVSWTVKSGAARVVLPRGDVFFRVEPGGPFVVATPAGDVEVRGTCFRVEVGEIRISKQTVTGAAVGAALTAAVLVTVYEGKVLFANERGQVEVRAGQAATARSGEPPAAAAAGKPVAAAKAEAPAPPRDNATREELLERDRAQRQELAALRVRVAEMERQASAQDRRGDILDGGESWFNPTRDELLQMARSCELRFDAPGVSEPQEVDAEAIKAAGLTQAEVQSVHAAFAEQAERTRAQMRAIYVEVTGNANAPEDLTTMAMWQEIQQKSNRQDVSDTAKLLSQERAGLTPPPKDLAARGPYERAMRLLSGTGGEAEQRLAGILGPEKAHALRAQNGGWSSHFSSRGCREGR